MKKNFEDLMAIADRLAAGQNQLKDTILKEVLHHEILYALQKSDLGKDLVFQGGTALRLCYGNQRYSEDLDFVRNAPLNPEYFEQFKASLKKSLAEHHELDVRILDPKKPLDERSTDHAIAVHRWVATIEIQKVGARNQKIHIEVADIPAYDARPRMINSPYAHFGVGSVLLNVSSEKEILADKVIAIAGRDYIKARDIWDIKWLTDKGIELNPDWVRKKAADYNLTSGGNMKPLLERLDQRIRDMALPETHQKFKDEMSRFLAKEQADLWLLDDTKSQLLLMDVAEFIERQMPRIDTPVKPSENGNTISDANRIKAWREKLGVGVENQGSGDQEV